MDTSKGEIKYVPLSKIKAQHHSIMGVVSDCPSFQFIRDDDSGGQERVRSMMENGFTYKELLSLSLTEQVNLIAERIMADCLPSPAFHAYENLFLICEHYQIAMAVSAIVGMAGCLSRIEQHEVSDAGQDYIVRIAPVSHQSSLNQLLLALYKEHPEGIKRWDGETSPLSLKTFYKRSLSDEYIGELPFDIALLSDDQRERAVSFLCGKAGSGSALDALTSAFSNDGLSVPYAGALLK